MRFSLLGLLALVTIFSIGLGLLATPSPLSLKLLNLLFLVCLVVSTVVAFSVPAERRAFWLGAAAVGWMYWLTLGFTKPDKDHPTRYSGTPADDLAVAVQSVLKHRTRIGEHVEGLRARQLELGHRPGGRRTAVFDPMGRRDAAALDDDSPARRDAGVSAVRPTR